MKTFIAVTAVASLVGCGDMTAIPHNQALPFASPTPTPSTSLPPDRADTVVIIKPAPIPVEPEPILIAGVADTLIQISWQPNADPITGYRVYYGPSPTETANQSSYIRFSEKPAFNPQAPVVTYYANRDLKLRSGDAVCFRLRSFNAANVISRFSPAACGTI